MLNLRLAASVANVEKGLYATKLALFSKYLSCLKNLLPFPVCLVLVLWLRWPLDKMLLLQSASIHCCLYFISTYGLDSGCCFLDRCTTSHLPVMQLVTRQRCTDVRDFEKRHCLAFLWFFVCFFCCCSYYCLIIGLFICGLFFICPWFENTVGFMFIFNFCRQLWYV